MRFRTEIELKRGSFAIGHDDRIVMLGSCFTDNVGSRLQRDGFEVTANPLGPLYNPYSLARVIEGALDGRCYSASDFLADSDGVFHCLDFASRYQDTDADRLAHTLNEEFGRLKDDIMRATVMIVTFGSSVVYSLTDDIDGTVGNCHKFPSAMFCRMPLSIESIAARWTALLDRLCAMGKNVILTVSPIRHLADGLHGNELSKARLLLACERLVAHADYFPSYEIMMDDLRDYRFYGADMKHPTDVACDYIYEKFSQTYFTTKTIDEARKHRDAVLRSAHRQIIRQ